MLRKILTIAALALPLAAHADPIITVLDGGNGVGSLGGYELTPYDAPADGAGCVSSAPSPIEGETGLSTNAYFQSLYDGNYCMTVDDPDWWQYDHGNVYTTWVPWVELILPAGTNAFSFYVGASFVGTGWIRAYDSNGDYTHLDFSDAGVTLGPGSTPGFGVHTADACTSITRIIIEPSYWGTGYFAGNQDPCVAVPEPAPIALLGIGLLGLALSRHLVRRRELLQSAMR